MYFLAVRFYQPREHVAATAAPVPVYGPRLALNTIANIEIDTVSKNGTKQQVPCIFVERRAQNNSKSNTDSLKSFKGGMSAFVLPRKQCAFIIFAVGRAVGQFCFTEFAHAHVFSNLHCII
jgi:hypothetical protein